MKRNILKTFFLSIALCFLITFVSVDASAVEFVYVLNDNTAGNNIYGYQINSSTGALTAIAGSPFATGGTGNGVTVSREIVIDSLNRRLYAINDGSDTISAYSINAATGALTALPFSPIALGTGGWYTIAVHPTGSPLIISDISNLAKSYNITALTATQAVGSPFATGSVSPVTSVFSRNGNYFYTGGDNSAFAGFSVNAVTGVLTTLAGSPYTSGLVGSIPTGYITDSQGRFYTVNFGATEVRAFTTTAGVPTAVTGNPFASGLSNGIDGALSPNETFYAAAARSSNNVGVYRISGTGAATTLAAVAGSPFASGGIYTDALVFNSTGGFLFAANGGSRNITKFNFNSTTGALTSQVVQAANTAGAAGLLTGIAYVNTATPTAGNVSISGRVTVGARNAGLTNAFVTLTDAQGITRKVLTSSFGYYAFSGVETGQNYTISVESKKYRFTPQVVNVADELTDVNFYSGDARR